MWLNAWVPPPPEAFWSSIEHGRLHHGTDTERAIEWQRLKAQGVRQGLPDILLCHQAKMAAIELKFGKNSLRFAQKYFRDAWLANGGIHVEARSIVELDEKLRFAGFDIPRSMSIAALEHDTALAIPEKKKKPRVWREPPVSDGGTLLEEVLAE